MDFLKRLSEPSTYAGLAAIFMGADKVFDINEAPAVADGLAVAGQAVAAGAPWWQAVAFGGLGVLSVFMGEKGRR